MEHVLNSDNEGTPESNEGHMDGSPTRLPHLMQQGRYEEHVSMSALREIAKVFEQIAGEFLATSTKATPPSTDSHDIGTVTPSYGARRESACVRPGPSHKPRAWKHKFR